MKRRQSRHVGSKWVKTAAIERYRRLRRHVPETRKLSRTNLEELLNRYGMVYVKPDTGTYGKGVMKIGKLQGGGYYSREKDRTRYHGSREALYRAIAARSRGRRYLVQQGIHLLAYRGRLFDVRVMVQKNPQRKWETTGIIGRAARPSYVVTNYHSGGRPMDVRTLLAPHLTVPQIRAMTARLSRIGRDAAAALGSVYPGVNMVGADIGVDARRNCWIIELNTSPDPYLFRFLKDRSVSRKVLRYARALKRIP